MDMLDGAINIIMHSTGITASILILSYFVSLALDALDKIV